MTEKTEFQNYLCGLGDEAAATKLNIKVRSARAYRLNERLPKRQNIPALILASGGELEYCDFFETQQIG